MKRTISIDVGIWNFSFAMVSKAPESPFVVERWCNESLPEIAGFPSSEKHISANAISITLLADITLQALDKLFPESFIRHEVDNVCIESQPRFKGKAGKVTELSSIIYTYFRTICIPSKICCWRFPRVQMISAGSKFDGGMFFGRRATDLLPSPKKNSTYSERKRYGVKLVEALLEGPDCTLCISESTLDTFRSAYKKDDFSDCLILAGASFRGT